MIKGCTIDACMETGMLIEKQLEIIHLETDIIDELSKILLQNNYITAVEMEHLPCWNKMQEAADLMKKMEV